MREQPIRQDELEDILSKWQSAFRRKSLLHKWLNAAEILAIWGACVLFIAIWFIGLAVCLLGLRYWLQ